VTHLFNRAARLGPIEQLVLWRNFYAIHGSTLEAKRETRSFSQPGGHLLILCRNIVLQYATMPSCGSTTKQQILDYSPNLSVFFFRICSSLWAKCAEAQPHLMSVPSRGFTAADAAAMVLSRVHMAIAHFENDNQHFPHTSNRFCFLFSSTSSVPFRSGNLYL